MAYYQKQTDDILGFNPGSGTVMHIDLNSCFATIEQQANPFLRKKPVAVAACTTPNGCILAASYEAKRYGVGGIETGMRIKDAKKICPSLIVLSPDPWKYRNIHLKLRTLLSDYTDDFHPKSIDEFVLHLDGRPCLKRKSIMEIGKEIKMRIKEEIGDYLTVSIGISTNRYLAKTASNLKKPDGLSEIHKDNYEEIFGTMPLTKLCGIKERNAKRLYRFGIANVLSFYKAELWQLKAAFESINAYYWYLRLHGWEIDDVPFGRRSYGNSYSIPQPLTTPLELAPILAKLVTKMSTRLRRAGYVAEGAHLAVSYRDHTYWHKGRKVGRKLFETRDIYQELYKLLLLSPCHTSVRNIAVSVFDLSKKTHTQLELFSDVEKKESVAYAMDSVNNLYGEYVLVPARMIDTNRFIPDRIAFGNIKELEEFTTRSDNL